VLINNRKEAMKKNPCANCRVRRMSPRQRKKQRVAEFKELSFDVDLVFSSPTDGEPYDDFINGFSDFLEGRGLLAGGFGGTMPLLETGGIVARADRGSAGEEDIAAVIEWLRARPEVKDARASHLFDAWYGYEPRARQ
jgi:uncharacterized protein YggL (DUF469 family)